MLEKQEGMLQMMEPSDEGQPRRPYASVELYEPQFVQWISTP